MFFGPAVAVFAASVEELLDLLHELGGEIDEPIEHGVVIDGEKPDLPLPCYEESNRLYHDAATATAAEREPGRGGAVAAVSFRLMLKLGSPGGETERNPGDRDNHAPVRRLHCVADNLVYIDHLFKIFHGGFHETFNGMMLHRPHLLLF
jgi:hypothetical protein